MDLPARNRVSVAMTARLLSMFKDKALKSLTAFTSTRLKKIWEQEIRD